MLAFDEPSHTYTWKGKPVTNVTRALAPLTDFSRIDPDVLETARQKGVAVHRMIELHAAGTLDADNLPEWMRPAHAFWLKFVDEAGVEIVASEQRVYHRIYAYAGTLDLVLRMRGMSGLGVVDVKRSLAYTPAVRLQTAAYREAWNNGRTKVDGYAEWCGALRLNETQPYRFAPFIGPKFADDMTMFLTSLRFQRDGEILEKWKEQNK